MAYLAQGKDVQAFAFYERSRAVGMSAELKEGIGVSSVMGTGEGRSATAARGERPTLPPNKHSVRPSPAPAVFTGHLGSSSSTPRPEQGQQDGTVPASPNPTNTDTNTDFHDNSSARTISRKQPLPFSKNPNAPPSSQSDILAYAVELKTLLERTRSRSPPLHLKPPPPPPPLPPRLIATAEGRRRIMQGERGAGLTRAGAEAGAEEGKRMGDGMGSRDFAVQRYMQEKKRGEDGKLLVELFRRA